MIRTTIIPDEKTISFSIPETYIGKQIEIIAFEKDEGMNELPQKKSVSFKAVSIDTKTYVFNRDEANER
ncbi:hypothetical protein [Mucilaginibacter sp.]|uniref:hypothetical protein n=1 Tax=Mucilaginibacter sp. TaxID=1882438 RepID=UPI003AFFA074